MSPSLDLPVARFLLTLAIVAKEGKHLTYSWNGLFNQTIDVEWVDSLEQNPSSAEQLKVFVSRFGRMQDTMTRMGQNKENLPEELTLPDQIKG